MSSGIHFQTIFSCNIDRDFLNIWLSKNSTLIRPDNFILYLRQVLQTLDLNRHRQQITL